MSYTYPSQHWPQTDAAAYNCSQSYISSNVLHQNIMPPQAPIPLSSYSSLAGALDFQNVTSNRNHSGHAYPHEQAIHRNRSSEDPHPVSPHNPPRHSQGQSQPLAPSTRSGRNYYLDEVPHPSSHAIKLSRSPSGPTNHVLVPQSDFKESDPAKSYTDPRFRHKSITFQSVNIPEPGVRVGKIVGQRFPAILDGKDAVLAVSGEREARLWILWPGYRMEPLQRRMKTHNGTITRDTVLMILANTILDFISMIQKKNIPVEKGYENWAISHRGDTKGIAGPELFITRLIHRGGSNWQPEIWAPRRL